MRALGWLVVIVGLLWGMASFWPAPREADVALDPDLLAQWPKIPESERSQWLARIERRLPSRHQVRVVQGVPDGKAVVIAEPWDSSEEENPSHWPLPWPRLNQALAKELSEASRLRESWKGYLYEHHVWPLDPQQKYFLVVTHTLREPAVGWTAWWGWRYLWLALMLGLAWWLWRTRGQ
jgi:hypothetical protein